VGFIKAQMRLWWDMVLPDGYGYAWGRSMALSVMKTLEIVVPGTASEFVRSTRSIGERLSSGLRCGKDYKKGACAFRLCIRPENSYITREREWQQTTGFLGKTALAHSFL